MDICTFNENQSKLPLKGKLVIIINGKGGAGKDTVCAIASKYYRVKIVSAITPIKEIASRYGWNGEKDIKSRKFLSDLKRVFIDYNDLPNRYLEGEYERFLQNNDDVLFVHIRENDQIDGFKNRVSSKCVTLIVRSSKIDNRNELYGNYSDDNVEDYNYDYHFTNGLPMEILEPTFMDFLNNIFIKEGIAFDEEPQNLPWRPNVHICRCD